MSPCIIKRDSDGARMEMLGCSCPECARLRAEVEKLKAKLPHDGEPCYGPGCHHCEAEQSDLDHAEAAQAGESKLDVT